MICESGCEYGRSSMDRDLNFGVHHNREWNDLNCNQKWIPFAVFQSDRIERTKGRFLYAISMFEPVEENAVIDGIKCSAKI